MELPSSEAEASPRKGQKGNKSDIIDPKLGVTFDSNGKVLMINKKPKMGVGKFEPVRTETNVQGLPKGWDWLNRNDRGPGK